MSLPDGSPLCGRIKVNEVESIAVGAQQVTYQCPNIASVVVDDTLVCIPCAGELTNEHDANLMASWSLTVHQWAEEMTHRPEINHWINQIADSLQRASGAIRESGRQ